MRAALMILVLLVAPASAGTPDDAARLDLQRGLAALSAQPPQRVYAYRLCRRAAELAGDHRAPALVCQGRAALLLKWPAEAARLAHAALREPRYPVGALVLLGDALRAQGKCPEARPIYLDALKSQEGNASAVAGLRACDADVPRLDEQPQDPPPLPPASLAHRGRP